MIPVYYLYDSSDNSILISGKDYVEYAEQYVDGANGIVDEEYGKEPYNYFYEIKEAMFELNYMENSESNFDVGTSTLQEVIMKMEAKGFQMIEDTD